MVQMLQEKSKVLAYGRGNYDRVLYRIEAEFSAFSFFIGATSHCRSVSFNEFPEAIDLIKLVINARLDWKSSVLSQEFVDDVVNDLIYWFPKRAPYNEPGHESS